MLASRKKVGSLLLSGTLLCCYCPAKAKSKSKLNPLTDVRRGPWSSESISLFNTFGGLGNDDGREASFSSPDKKKIVRIHNQTVTISIDGKEVPTDFWLRPSAELGWSPDSARFFLTWTDGGELGQWHVQIFNVMSDGLHEVSNIEEAPRKDFEELIRKLPVPKKMSGDYERRYWDSLEYCSANVVASQWLHGSSELLVSVLVPNSGGCRYMSEFNVYRVSVPSGAILERYSAEKAHKIFKRENLPLITH
jgi:hypothetical protein